MQALFHLYELGNLAFLEPRVAALELGQPRLRGLDLLFNLHRLSVAELRGLREICGALGPVGLGTHLLELRLEAADLTDDLFLLLPARAQRCPLLRQFRKLLLERGEALLGYLVGLLLERLALDLELADLAFDLVE